MGDDRQHSPARRARVDAWRRAWFNGLDRTSDLDAGENPIHPARKAVTLRRSVAVSPGT